MILMLWYFTLNPTPANAVANRNVLIGFTKDAAMGPHRSLVNGTKRSAEFKRVATMKARAKNGIPSLPLVIPESFLPSEKTRVAIRTTGAIMKIRTDFVTKIGRA